MQLQLLLMETLPLLHRQGCFAGVGSYMPAASTSGISSAAAWLLQIASMSTLHHETGDPCGGKSCNSGERTCEETKEEDERAV